MSKTSVKFGVNLIRVSLETLPELLNQKTRIKLPKVSAQEFYCEHTPSKTISRSIIKNLNCI